MAKTKVKVAKTASGVRPAIGILGKTAASRKISPGSDWRSPTSSWETEKINTKPEHKRLEQFQGLQVFYPVDPYSPTERKEFRTAMNNVYVYRAARILTTFVAGQGYTTKIVPRVEEDLNDDELDMFKSQTTYIPYWDKDMTFDELKDRIDKMAIDMDLSTQIFNAYYTSLEQGRCVLALTPLDPEENDKYSLPTEIRFIRPEFTLRPILDANTQELLGCYVIGSRSTRTPSAISKERMIYIQHAFNNELFSDFYGDSKIARISDIANNLNLILNQDYERIAEQTWHKPNVWLLPIPPQNVGQEEDIIAEFLQNDNQNAKGRDIAVAVSASNDERIVEKISNQNNSGDIGGLDNIRLGLIKGVVTAFGLPGFMLSEGDIGSLGGTANIEEVDMFLNTEVKPEREKLEVMLESQFYDRILCILYDVDEPEDLPVKIKHQYNKPTLLTLLTPQMITSLETLVQNQWIEPSALTQILHLEKYKKETESKGEQPEDMTRKGWNTSWSGVGPAPTGWGEENGWNTAVDSWGEENNEANNWNRTPLGGWKYPSLKWSNGSKIDKRQEGQAT